MLFLKTYINKQYNENITNVHVANHRSRMIGLLRTVHVKHSNSEIEAEITKLRGENSDLREQLQMLLDDSSKLIEKFDALVAWANGKRGEAFK